MPQYLVANYLPTTVLPSQKRTAADGIRSYVLHDGKEGYGGDSTPHWPPHLMFFYSDTDPAI